MEKIWMVDDTIANLKRRTTLLKLPRTTFLLVTKAQADCWEWRVSKKTPVELTSVNTSIYIRALSNSDARHGAPESHQSHMHNRNRHRRKVNGRDTDKVERERR